MRIKINCLNRYAINADGIKTPQIYKSENLLYSGGGVCREVVTKLGKNEFFLMCEEIGTTNFVLGHFYFVYDGATKPSYTTISSNVMSFGSNTIYGTQVVDGYTGDGSAGTLRWTAW